MVNFISTCPDPSFWRNRKVLLTGQTGFKGSWLALILSSYGASVSGIGLKPVTEKSLYELCNIESLIDSHICDIRNYEKTALQIEKFNPEIVIHMAALPLVRESYEKPLETFDTNVMGTANVLNALKNQSNLKSVVCVTTDKVYKNKEQLHPYKETDELGGHDPYSASKAASELIISSFRSSYFSDGRVGLASARAGNVIGGGDWSADRLIPDAIRAWNNDSVLSIRYPDAIRPWQHVIEPLHGYLVLAQKLYQDSSLSGSYNFGPDVDDNKSVKSIIKSSKKHFGKGRVQFSNSSNSLHETGLLTLDNRKVKSKLGVYPVLTHEMAVERTINWYKAQVNGVNPMELCIADIAFYRENLV
jgi:CDP-glucose 4,6-dehydratase